MPFSVYLIFPPMWSPKQPYLSLPSLTAYLKMHGFQVRQRDLNIETFNDFLTEGRIHSSLERIKSRISGLEKAPALSTDEVNEYTALARAATTAPHIAGVLNEANRMIRNPKTFYDPPQFSRARKIQEEALKIISTAYYPAVFDFYKLQMKYPYFSSRAVREAIRDRDNNFLLDYFEQRVIPDLIEMKPDILGLSICSPDQLIPAVTLADLAKKAVPGLPIYAGGGFYTNIYEGRRALRSDTLFLDLFDGIVIYEGEMPLLQICRALEADHQDALKDIPNLIREEGGKARVSGTIVFEDMDKLPAPDFSEFPLTAYYYPEPVLPLLTSRGCYWKRCAFCTSFDIYQSGFRQRSVDRVISDIQALKDQHGPSGIFFADQAITPAFLKRLSARLIEEEAGIHWAFEGRFERQYTPDFLRLLKEAGCVKILFGLESANQRVLDLMDKGYSLDMVSRIMDDCLLAEIAMHLFMIIGFPTETRREAEDTVRFILDRRRLLESPAFSHVFHKS